MTFIIVITPRCCAAQLDLRFGELKSSPTHSSSSHIPPMHTVDQNGILNTRAAWLPAHLGAVLITCCLLFCTSAPGQDLSSTEDDQAPRLLFQSEPVLPDEASLGIEGRSVTLDLLVETDGRVSEVVVVGSGGAVLDAAARAALLDSRFVPATRGGYPARGRIRFRLEFAPQKTPHASQSPAATSVDVPESIKTITPPRPTEAPVDQLVVVTGARAPELGSQAISRTEVVSRSEMEEAGMLNLEDALFARPGIQMQRTFRGTDLWIRGLDPRYSLILVDGMRLSGRVGGSLDLTRFVTERIERVEIVRGPSSALYGSEAIGGVVNMISRDIDGPSQVDAEMRMGSKDAYSGSARGAARPIESLGVEASLGRQHTAAFRADGESEATSGSDRTTDYLSGAFDVGKSIKNRLSARMDYTKVDLRGVDAGAGSALFDRRQLQEQIQSSLLYRWEQKKWYLNQGVSYSLFREQTVNDQRGSDALDSYEDSREHLAELSSTADYTWNRQQRSTAGADLLVQTMRSPRLDENGQRQRYALFAQHRLQFDPTDDSQFVIVPGARVDVDSQFGSQVSPKLALRYQPVETLQLRAGYGRGFRAPSFQQLLLRFENPSVGYVVDGNPELSAESAHSYDLSLEFQPHRGISIYAAGFRNDLRDMIAVVTISDGAGETTFGYDNLERARTQGVESQVTIEPRREITLSSGYTWTDTWNGENDRKIEGQAPHLFTARLRLAHNPTELLFVARSSLSVGRPYYIEDDEGVGEETVASPLAQVDLRLSKSFGRAFELFCGVDNLLNAGDEFALLLPRQYYAGLRGRY